jgi:hypothetical protein
MLRMLQFVGCTLGVNNPKLPLICPPRVPPLCQSNGGTGTVVQNEIEVDALVGSNNGIRQSGTQAERLCDLGRWTRREACLGDDIPPRDNNCEEYHDCEPLCGLSTHRENNVLNLFSL